VGQALGADHDRVSEGPALSRASPDTRKVPLPRPARPPGTLDFFLFLAAHARIKLAAGKLHGDVLSDRDLVG